jgi:hypothetical protein
VGLFAERTDRLRILPMVTPYLLKLETCAYHLFLSGSASIIISSSATVPNLLSSPYSSYLDVTPPCTLAFPHTLLKIVLVCKLLMAFCALT